MIASTLLSAIALAGLSAAQTYTDCDPTEKECPAAPALGNQQINCDLTAGMCDGFTQLDSTNITFSEKGALFRIENENQAPTIATDKYIFFGRVEVECQAAAGQGIVTAIVLLSADLDEIDWEWVGGEDSDVQSNCFGKAGVGTTYTCVSHHTVSEPFTTYHTYGFEWTSSALKWLIDGEVVRTLAYGDAEGGSRFPQTPSQVKIGTWVGGKESNSDGLIWWAGGLTDFDQAPFDAYYKSVKVIDYAGGDSPAEESILEYVYGDKTGSWESIEVVKGDAVSSSSSSSTTPTSTAAEKTASTTSSVPTASSSASSSVSSSANSSVSSSVSSSASSPTSTPASPSATFDSTSSAENSQTQSPVNSTIQTTASKTTATESVPISNSATSSTRAASADQSNSSVQTDISPSSTPATTHDTYPSVTAFPSNSEEQLTTSTIFSTSIYTVTSCAATVTNCPADSTVIVTETIPVFTTICPISTSPTKHESGNSPVATSNPGEQWTTSTIFATSIHTVTSCAPTVTNCPADSTALITETVAVSTTVRPISVQPSGNQSSNSPQTSSGTSPFPSNNNSSLDDEKPLPSTSLNLSQSVTDIPAKDTQGVHPTAGAPSSTASGLSNNSPASPSSSGFVHSSVVISLTSPYPTPSSNGTTSPLALPTAGAGRPVKGVGLAIFLTFLLVLLE